MIIKWLLDAKRKHLSQLLLTKKENQSLAMKGTAATNARGLRLFYGCASQREVAIGGADPATSQRLALRRAFQEGFECGDACAVAIEPLPV
jgi:hypothetical protein